LPAASKRTGQAPGVPWPPEAARLIPVGGHFTGQRPGAGLRRHPPGGNRLAHWSANGRAGAGGGEGHR